MGVVLLLGNHQDQNPLRPIQLQQKLTVASNNPKVVSTGIKSVMNKEEGRKSVSKRTVRM